MTALLWAGLIVAAFAVGILIWSRALAKREDFLDRDDWWRGPL